MIACQFGISQHLSMMWSVSVSILVSERYILRKHTTEKIQQRPDTRPERCPCPSLGKDECQKAILKEGTQVGKAEESQIKQDLT